MPYVAAKCHALLIPSGTYHDPARKHLFIVCTDCCEKGMHLLVSITGWTNDLCDPTVRLRPGDHPFINKDSYAFFRKARIESAKALQAGVDQGLFIEHTTASQALVTRIMQGVCGSTQTPRKVRQYAGCPPR